MEGARVTDAVEYYARRGEQKGAVRVIRRREPDRLRWRSAVDRLMVDTGRLRGRDRFRIEEPVREVVLEMPDAHLQREVVIDARRRNVDLDRGEVLPIHRMGDLRRFAFLAGTDVRTIERYLTLPTDFDAPIDTAGVVVVSRAMANHHRLRSQKLWLELPDPDGPYRYRAHQRFIAERAERDADAARRWGALSKALVGA